MARAPKKLSALRANRDFRLLWVGGLLTGLGSQFSALALPLLILEETHSSATAGLVASVSAAALLLTLLPGGAVADATERRRLMLLCQCAAVLSCAALAACVLAGRPVLVLVIAVSVIGAVLGSLYAPAAGALLRSAVPGEQLRFAVSRLQARSAAARLVGPLLGGVLYSMSPALPLVVEAVGLAGSMLCLLAVRARAVPAARGRSPLAPRELTAGLTFIWGQPFIRSTLLIFGVGLNTAFGGAVLVGTASLASLDPTGRSVGMFTALAAAGSLAGALLAPKLRSHQRPRATILLCSWTAACAVPLMALAPNGVVMGAFIAPCMLVAGLGNNAFATVMLLVTPTNLTGRVQTAAGFASMLAQPIGPLAGGLLADRIGTGPTFGLLGAVLAVAAAVATVAPGLRTVPSAEFAAGGPVSTVARCTRDYCTRPGCSGTRVLQGVG